MLIEKNNRFNLILMLLILMGLTLGCLGPGVDSDKCTGTVKSKDKTYVGAAKDEDQAGLNSCNKFCLEEDSEYEAMYAIWLTSERAKNLEKSRGKKVSKQDALFEDKGLLNYITKNCAVRCVKEANQGRHTLETSCKK